MCYNFVNKNLKRLMILLSIVKVAIQAYLIYTKTVLFVYTLALILMSTLNFKRL